MNENTSDKYKQESNQIVLEQTNEIGITFTQKNPIEQIEKPGKIDDY